MHSPGHRSGIPHLLAQLQRLLPLAPGAQALRVAALYSPAGPTTNLSLRVVADPEIFVCNLVATG
jgi:hypothetical protein